MKHEYEKTQDLNLITRTLHSIRYKNLAKLVKYTAQKNKTLKVVDVGCGPAKSYKVIKNLDISFQYIGIDNWQPFVEIAKERYGEFENFEIICDSIENVFHVFVGNDASF